MKAAARKKKKKRGANAIIVQKLEFIFLLRVAYYYYPRWASNLQRQLRPPVFRIAFKGPAHERKKQEELPIRRFAMGTANIQQQLP